MAFTLHQLVFGLRKRDSEFQEQMFLNLLFQTTLRTESFERLYETVWKHPRGNLSLFPIYLLRTCSICRMFSLFLSPLFHLSSIQPQTHSVSEN